MKGTLEQDQASEPEVRLVSGEVTDVGESSEDSAIVSAERERIDPDASAKTTITSLPSTSSSVVTIKTSRRPSEFPGGDQVDGRQGDEEIDGEEEDEEQGDVEARRMSVLTRVKGWTNILIMFLESCVISATVKLNSLSRDYRYVARRLSVEKRYLKNIFEIEGKEGEGKRYEFMDATWKKATLAKISQVSVPKFSKSFDSVEESTLKKKKAGGDGKIELSAKKSSGGTEK